MSLVFIGLGVLLLLLLMVVFKLNAFISLIIVSLIVAVLEGMSPLEAIASVEKGLEVHSAIWRWFLALERCLVN